MADIGSTLGGRYRLIELLGQGGMATIYRARDSQLERDVAVKVLRPEYGADPDFLERFRHEAQAAASLSHPSIVAVYDYGTDPAGPFIVMELVDGQDLASLLRRRGPLPPIQAACVAAEVARALAAAHANGIVHRDVKPGNILVTSDNRIKVADFGIARAVAEAALTMPGTTLGSIHYFSPEQARGELATPASDIYSLGIVLYEMLTGQRPWSGDSAAAVATARLSAPVPSPKAVNGSVPDALDAIDQRAMATDPADRFGSATEMAEALDAFVTDARAAVATSRAAEAAVGGAAGGGLAAAAGAGAVSQALAGGGADAARTAESPTGATIASGVARPNPNASAPYAADAYAGAPDDRGVRRAEVVDDDAVDDDGGGSRSAAWLWISALLALGVLALAGFLLFRLLSSTNAPAGAQVTVPDFTGRTYADASALAGQLGLQVVEANFETSDQPIGTVTQQDPIAGTQVAPNSTVKLTIAIGQATTIVPDLVGQTESAALNLIAQAGLTIGTRTDAYDPVVPLGDIVQQNPGAGASVAKGTVVDYVVSKGPEPSPSAAPTPSPTPQPTPPPTPQPTPPPTPTPVPPTPTPVPPTPTPVPPTPTPSPTP
ncbi:MAG TPA: Stk1 family PASTA domain-containing Ser/Thr kinase [Candidatus Limnocylindrales bacterium]|nr:Stk1 family PASTA domain-containing Ser/Thr kinase [Candidatus Limnocylindrales bacterium]